MKRRGKILLGFLGALIMAPTLLLYYVVATEAGLQLLAGQLNRPIGPVTITLTGASGSLLRGFSFEHFRIQHRLSDIDMRGLSGEVEFAPLLVQRIHVRRVRLEQLDITVLPVERTGGRPWQPRFLPPTLQVDIDEGRLERGSLTALNGRRYVIEDLSTRVAIHPKQIRMTQIGVALPDYLLRVGGRMRLQAAVPFQLDGDLSLRYLPRDLPEWSIAAHFDGDLDTLPLRLRMDKPFGAQVEGTATSLRSGWKFAGEAQLQDLDLTTFGGGDALGLISGQFDVQASGQGYQAEGVLTPAGLGAGAFDVTFDGFYGARRLEIRSASARHQQSGSRATTQGSVTLTQPGQMLDLEGSWSNFVWPLTGGESSFSSAQGNYTLRGPKPWNVTADGSLRAAQWPETPFTLTGVLDGERFAISNAELQLLGGRTQLTGSAQWKPAEQWEVAGRAFDIDPSSLRDDLPGRLSFGYRATGAPFGEGAALSVSVEQLSGRLRGATASGRGRVTKAAGSEDWHFEGVDLRFDRTRLQLNGGLGTQRDLDFAIDADDLSLLDATARGRVSARGRIAGTAAAPIALFKARGSDFEWQGNELAALDADVDVDLGPNGRTEGQVQLSGIRYGGREIQRAAVVLSGRPDAQRIVVNLEAAPLRSGLTADGAFSQGLWSGTVQSLRIDDIDADRNLRLALEAPAPLEFSRSTVSLGQMCLKGAAERLCLALQRDLASWSSRFSADQLPLRALTAGLTQNIQYDGTIDLNGTAQGGAQRAPTGELHATLAQAELVQRLSNNRVERMALGTGRVDAEATADAFSASVSLDAGSSGSISGQLQGQRDQGPWQQFPIDGALKLTTDSLGVLDLYVTEIDRAVGLLETDVTIGGTLGTPVIAGRLKLSNASIDIYQVNLLLRDLNFEAAFDANTLQLAGQAKVGAGTAKFNGELAWRNQEPHGNLHLEGENLRIVDVPEARIDASPNLDFKLAGRRIDATGTVKIPEARLEPADLTNAVLSSNDETLVGEPQVDPSQRWLVVSDIHLELGDKVEVDTLGLKAHLGGRLNVRSDESGITRGLGELNVTSGRYSALGRLLDITRGRLLFNNGPLGDPGIDLRAQKEFPDVIAGVNVRGTLRAPRMTFFSDPSIPQLQIASLILAGGSLESVQNSEQNGAARNDLLAQGGAILAQQLGNRVGIEDIGIESDLNNETSLVLGKYLSPRLYVSYGISLAEAINTVKLRYTIDDRWTVKTESGKEQSADIVYTLRR